MSEVCVRVRLCAPSGSLAPESVSAPALRSAGVRGREPADPHVAGPRLQGVLAARGRVLLGAELRAATNSVPQQRRLLFAALAP